MVKVLVVGLVLLTAALGAPGAAAADPPGSTVASVLRAQQRLAPEPLRRPSTQASLALGGVGGSVAPGTDHTCVAVVYANVWCWGANDRGQLGDGSTRDSADPVSASATGRLADQVILGVTAGRAHTCAATLEGEAFSAYCWGANDRGQLGDGSLDDRNRPAEVAANILGLATGAEHTCVLGADLDVSCWGRNDDGRLGVDTGGADSPSPQEVPGLTDVVDLAAGEDSTCAVDDDGKLSCWGALAGSASPVPLPGTDYAQVSVGRRHACAVAGSALTGGPVYCWGADGAGQLGNGSGTADSAVPVRVSGTRRYVSVSAAGDSTCAVSVTGQGYCWGDNSAGQLGTGDTEGHAVPVAVDQSPVTTAAVVRELYGARESMIVELTAGPDRSCAVGADTVLYCTAGGALARIPLGPEPVRHLRAAARDGAIRVSWTPPARTGAAPILGYSAVAVSADRQSVSGCSVRGRACTVDELTNDRRYAVFVIAVSTGGISYSAIARATPKGGGGDGGGLPVTGPGGLAAAGAAWVCLGLAVLLAGRRRRV